MAATGKNWNGLLRVVGLVWLAGVFVTLGYFAVRDVHIFPALRQGLQAEPGPVKHLIPTRIETPGKR